MIHHHRHHHHQQQQVKATFTQKTSIRVYILPLLVSPDRIKSQIADRIKLQIAIEILSYPGREEERRGGEEDG